MTTTSPGGVEIAGLVRAHGADLHRLAAALTADTQRATELTARTLAGADARPRPGGTSTDRLRTDLVRRYLRSVPRRPDRLPTRGGDAGDVLHMLSPRARAASALRLLEGWSAERTAEALGTTAHRVETLVPPVAGLGLALAAIADQHVLTGPALDATLLEATEDGRAGPRPGRRRWVGWAVPAALVSILVTGYAVAGDHDDAAGEETPVVQASGQDLTAAGWKLDDDGDPPPGAMGMVLRGTTTVDEAEPTRPVIIPATSGYAFATFAVLWCDMPPAQDDHLRVPAGRVSVDDALVELPCAGRDGTPPVTRLVALPPARPAQLEVTGDLPDGGGATLAFYSEIDYLPGPVPDRTVLDPPAVREEATVLDLGDSVAAPSSWPGRRTADVLSVAHDSTVEVWAGRTALVSVVVDGTPVTDDGDVAAWRSAIAGRSDDYGLYPTMPPLAPGRPVDWAGQQPDLRDGYWAVHAAGATRSFALPEDVAPAPGRRRTVTVEVHFSGTGDEDLRVAVTDARPVHVDTRPILAAPRADAPELVLGHRHVGRWQVPADGHLRELRLADGTRVPSSVVVLAVGGRNADDVWFPWSGGLLAHDRLTPGQLVPEPDLSAALETMARFAAWPPEGDGPLTVAAPAAPDRRPLTVLAYEAVPYEEFDFAAATPPPRAEGLTDLGPTGGYGQAVTIRPEDLEAGSVTVPVSDATVVTARVTTEGRGRLRFLLDRQPTDVLPDGWWSSWTEERVSAEVPVAYPWFPRGRMQLTVVVEDYENFLIEVMTG